MSDDDFLPSPEQIIRIHDRIEEQWDMKFTGARVAAPRLKFRNILAATREYEDVYMRAGHLLRNIITAHPFEDGNKRTAWVTTRRYLRYHDLQPAEHRQVVVGHVLRSIRSYDVDEIAEWLESGDIDRSRLNP